MAAMVAEFHTKNTSSFRGKINREQSAPSVSHILLILKVNDSRKKLTANYSLCGLFCDQFYLSKYLAPTLHFFIYCFRITPILLPAGLNALISIYFPFLFSEAVLIQVIHFLSLLLKVESCFLISHVFCSISVSLEIVLA